MMTLLVAIFGSFLAILFVHYLQFRNLAIDEYRQFAGTFFENAEKLISHEDTPVELLEVIGALNETISDREAAGRLLTYFTDEDRWRESDLVIHRRKILSAYFVQQPDMENIYRLALVDWFLAVTALSPVRGKIARWAMSEGAVEEAAARNARLHFQAGASRAAPA